MQTLFCKRKSECIFSIFTEWISSHFTVLFFCNCTIIWIGCMLCFKMKTLLTVKTHLVWMHPNLNLMQSYHLVRPSVTQFNQLREIKENPKCYSKYQSLIQYAIMESSVTVCKYFMYLKWFIFIQGRGLQTSIKLYAYVHGIGCLCVTMPSILSLLNKQYIK